MFVRTPRMGNDAKRRDGAGDRGVARLAVRDQLREHRIVVDRHVAAFDDAAVDADAGARRFAIEQQRARLRQETRRRILRVDAALDRVPALRRSSCAPRQRLPHRDEQLRAHEVDAGDQLGDRVLDLEPRVHLEEVEARARSPSPSSRNSIVPAFGSRRPAPPRSRPRPSARATPA